MLLSVQHLQETKAQLEKEITDLQRHLDNISHDLDVQQQTDHREQQQNNTEYINKLKTELDQRPFKKLNYLNRTTRSRTMTRGTYDTRRLHSNHVPQHQTHDNNRPPALMSIRIPDQHQRPETTHREPQPTQEHHQQHDQRPENHQRHQQQQHEQQQHRREQQQHYQHDSRNYHQYHRYQPEQYNQYHQYQPRQHHDPAHNDVKQQIQNIAQTLHFLQQSIQPLLDQHFL